MKEGEKLTGRHTIKSLAIVDWMVSMLESFEFTSLGKCLDRVIDEQSRDGHYHLRSLISALEKSESSPTKRFPTKIVEENLPEVENH